MVEQQIATGDGQGHGPDPGSAEWRSTVEFKLGIRDDPAVPPLDSNQWCHYINERFIKNPAKSDYRAYRAPAVCACGARSDLCWQLLRAL